MGWAKLLKAIREGLRPDGSLIGPPMPIEFYRHLSDADVDAIVAYPRAQPVVSAGQPKSVYRIPLPPNYGPPLGKVNAPPGATSGATASTPCASATAWSATARARPRANW